MFIPRFHVYRAHSRLLLMCVVHRPRRRPADRRVCVLTQPDRMGRSHAVWSSGQKMLSSSAGIETLSPPPSRLSILLNRKTVCLIWFISLVLIYRPVLLCVSVVWAKPAWEELQGNWLYWKFNQRSQEVTKMQSVGEGNQAGCSGLSSNLILLMLHPLTNNTSRHTPYYRSNCSLQPVGKKRDSHLISMIIIWMHNVHLGYRKSHVIPVI